MNNKAVSIIIVTLAIALAGYVIYSQTKSPVQKDVTTPTASTEDTNLVGEEPDKELAETKIPTDGVAMPISDASTRITKKAYGTYVNPKNSPVSPEVFTGYHTGVDFETTSEEAKTDVVINAICAGKLLRKTTAQGYGGYALQSCTINNQAVTVVYGHLRLSSISAAVGDELKIGDTLGLLGTGYSSETSNERKHLHLSIHIGSGINIKGYVQTKSELSDWLDPKVVLGL
jgi:murein DD-endopeptidase MepM/ murein hydrolase activator NlpD